MANYLMRYKGTYRILPELDYETHDFPRDCDDNRDEDMIYIPCKSDSKIMYYGNGVLIAYIPSTIRGKNIKKAMSKEKIEFFDYDESAEESVCKFKAKDIDAVAELMGAKTYGANISPFSSKNLPKTKIEIPVEEMAKYQAISSKVQKGDTLFIKDVNNRFLTEIIVKKSRKQDKNFDVKADMKRMKLGRQTKEYIFVKGMFEDYLKYLDEEIDRFYNNK